MQSPEALYLYKSHLKQGPAKKIVRTQSAQLNRSKEIEKYFLIPASQINIRKFQRAKSCKCKRCRGQGVNRAERVFKMAYFYEQHIDQILKYESIPKEMVVQKINKKEEKKEKVHIKKQLSEILPQVQIIRDKQRKQFDLSPGLVTSEDKSLCPQKPQTNFITKILSKLRNQNFENSQKKIMSLIYQREKEKPKQPIHINRQKSDLAYKQEKVQASQVKQQGEQEDNQEVSQKNQVKILSKKPEVKKSSQTLLETKRHKSRHSNLTQFSGVSAIINQESITQDLSKRFEDLKLKFNSKSVKHNSFGTDLLTSNLNSAREVVTLPSVVNGYQKLSKNAFTFDDKEIQ